MTSPSPTDKVIDIQARSAGGRETTPMLATIRSRSLKRLSGVLAEILDKADDTLFDFVQSGDSSVSNQEYFDAMREVRKQRPLVEQRYVEHLSAAFTALERRNPLLVDLERSVTETRELSLVSEDQLEEQLGTSMISTALTRLLGPMLMQLNYRLGILASVEGLEDRGNPIAPPHIAYSFRYALSVCEISIRIKVLLFKLYEREMARNLATFYNDTNRALVEAGIAPEIKPTYARTPQVQREVSRTNPDGVQGVSPEVAQNSPGSMPPPGPNMRYMRAPETVPVVAVHCGATVRWTG